jgi:5-methylthioribose kinase
VANEISNIPAPYDSVRRKYLVKLSEKTGRNVIAYYSGWQSKAPIRGLEIRDEDMDGFMSAINGLDVKSGLDLILHTPGGELAAAQSIVRYLKSKFSRDIRAIVPHSAMSAGTIIACACREILMAKHSFIGPIDPQIGGLPANGVLEEFERAYREIKDDPSRAIIWGPILKQYPPTFIGMCENAIAWSKAFVEEQLSDTMFQSEKNKSAKIKNVIQALTSYDRVKSHSRQIGCDEAAAIGLKIIPIEAEQDLQDLILTVHHCYVHMLSNTQVFKVIENQNGAAFIKIARNS